MNTENHQRLVHSFQGLSDDAFVMKAYLTLLGRASDPGGAAAYVSRLRAGVPRVQVWTEIFEGHEGYDFAVRQAGRHNIAGPRGSAQSVEVLLGLDGAEFIRQAYGAVLGREADPDGLRTYLSRLASGTPKQQLLADLRSDPEGLAYASQLPGLDDLVRQVQSGVAASAGSLSLDDLLALHGAAFVRAAYLALFKREPDVEGLARYVEVLRSGMSAMYVLKALYDAPEAREKSVRFPGLAEAIRSYDKAQARSWQGWYHRAIMGSLSELPAERQFRALTYRVREAKG
jgi:hypothetical protein